MKPIFIAFIAACVAFSTPATQAQSGAQTTTAQDPTMPHQQTLTTRQQAILPIAAFTASGDMHRLDPALRQGLDAGLTVNEIKEMLVQLYAYAGFPRSLNALGEFMKVLEARKAQGINDPQGRKPGPLPLPEKMLEAGTANQTQLVGAPVSGPLFEFAPQVNRYLKEHLFGAIFARDNLDWQDRELTTLGALAALPGVDSQLASHMRISRNIDISEPQLQEVVTVLRERVSPEVADRAEIARSKSAASH